MCGIAKCGLRLLSIAKNNSTTDNFRTFLFTVFHDRRKIRAAASTIRSNYYTKVAALPVNHCKYHVDRGRDENIFTAFLHTTTFPSPDEVFVKA